MTGDQMAKAYVLINTDVGKEDEVLERIKSFNGIEDAHVVYGTYDMIVKVKAKDQAELKQTILKQFRVLDSLRGTITLIAVDD